MKNLNPSVPSSGIDLKQSAINAAIAGDWQQAVEINKKLLADHPQNSEALNRLARAYFVLGNVIEAKKTYRRVLDIDPYNQIASNNLKRLSKVDGNGNGTNGHSIDFNVFIAEPGTTKLINLIKVATPQTLSQLTCGEKLDISPKKHSVVVTTFDKIYLGALPDDLAHLLLSLMDGGNKYEVFVKKVTNNNLQILIRETFRSPRFISQPSFIEITAKTYFMPVRREPAISEDSTPVSPEAEAEENLSASPSPIVSDDDEEEND
ncbi:MAG TPA: tetratricopeptide repeat protein [Patescibacteria group bacterium]